MRLDLMTSPEIDAYRRRTPGVILPVGSLEQHGAQGLLGTDALAAEAAAPETGAVQSRLCRHDVAAPVDDDGAGGRFDRVARTRRLRPRADGQRPWRQYR